MKSILDKWRKFKNKNKSDVSGDGVEPVNPSVLDVHAGGPESTDMPVLRAPDSDVSPVSSYYDGNIKDMTKGAPIKDRKALQIDAIDPDHPWDALIALQKDVHQFIKSDRELNKPQMADFFNRVIDMREKELTSLEAANTISAQESEKLRKALEGFREAMAHSDTLDIDLFKLGRNRKNIANPDTPTEVSFPPIHENEDWIQKWKGYLNESPQEFIYLKEEDYLDLEETTRVPGSQSKSSGSVKAQVKRVLKKAAEIAKDPKVQLGAQIAWQAAKDKKVSFNKISQLFFDLDPVKGLKVDIGKLKELGQKEAVYGINLAAAFEE